MSVGQFDAELRTMAERRDFKEKEDEFHPYDIIVIKLLEREPRQDAAARIYAPDPRESD